MDRSAKGTFWRRRGRATGSALNRRVRIGVFALFVAALALRLGYCWFKTGFGPSPSYREYAMTGRRLLEHGRLLSPMVLDDHAASLSAQLPPVYVALVAGVYGLLGTESFAAECTIQLFNVLATSLAAVGAFFVARRLAGDRAGWIAAVLLSINPVCFGYVDIVWDTSLFTLGVVVTLYFCVRLREGPCTRDRWFAFGLWLGALALINPAATLAYPFLVLWPLATSGRWHLRPIARGVTMAVLGWLMAITPWNVRSYLQLGELIYVRDGLRLEFWLGSCPEADTDRSAVYKKRYALDNEDVQRRVAEIGEVRYIEECGKRAFEAITADPWRFVRLSAVRTVDYWLGTAYSHNPPGTGGLPRSTQRVAVMAFLMIEFLALAALLLRRPSPGRDVAKVIAAAPQGGAWSPPAGRDVGRTMDAHSLPSWSLAARRDARWLLAAAVASCLVYCLTHVQIRYRAPSEPMIALALALLAAQRSSPTPSPPGRGSG